MALDIGPPVAIGALFVGTVVFAACRQWLIAAALVVLFPVFAVRALWPTNALGFPLSLLSMAAMVALVVAVIRQARSASGPGGSLW